MSIDDNVHFEIAEKEIEEAERLAIEYRQVIGEMQQAGRDTAHEEGILEQFIGALHQAYKHSRALTLH